MKAIVTRSIAVLAVAVAVVAVWDTGCRTTPPVVAPEAAQNEDGFQPFDTPPTLTRYVEPHYPEAARRDGREGTVILRVVVDTDGSVAETSLLNTSDDAFVAAAVAAARQFRFEPGRLEGKAVRCIVVVPVKFSL